MQITIYTINNCADCGFVLRLLNQKNLSFKEVNLDNIPNGREVFNQTWPGVNQVPLVLVDGKKLDHFTQVALLEVPA